MHKWWIISFAFCAPLTLVAAFIALFILTSTPKQPSVALLSPLPILQAQQAPAPIITSEVYSSDARPIIVYNYLKKYKSVLIDYVDDMISISDKYEIDFRLLAAIAQQESNLCKKAPAGSYNCWGWGIHSGKVKTFESYPAAMEAVAKWLHNHAQKGLDTPEEVMIRYNPPSIQSGTGAWAKGVNEFIEKMQ